MSASPLSDDAPQPSFTPLAQVVREPMFAENRAALLGNLLDGVQALDFDTLDAARANGQSYAAALTAATECLPVRVPGASLGSAASFDAFADGHQHAPVPPAEPEADSTWLLDFLGDLLDDAAEGAGRRISEPCSSCPGKLSGWCEECQDALARAARYSRLAELIEAAPADRAAVLVLMAGAWRQTAPEDASAEGDG